ncbi:MAG: GNAT family N-acetyltransferase [Christensenellaceae bacterium]|jgi:ribosomal protein S18 acetylase RimI-like enzyme
MEFVELTKENLEKEHVCCALSDKPCQNAKKSWLAERIGEGYTFLKYAGSGKTFIEYGPAEYAWSPVAAPGYVFIDCFWVSGKFAGQGIGKALLSRATEAAKAEGKAGLCAVCGDTKKPFLSDPAFYKKQGFLVADTAPPYYELLYLPLEQGGKAPVPRFGDSVKSGKTDKPGIVVYYTDHCPWNAKYIPKLAEVAQTKNAPFEAVKIESTKQAQSAPNPFTAYAVYSNGEFVTNEMFSEKKFEKFLREQGY